MTLVQHSEHTLGEKQDHCRSSATHISIFTLTLLTDSKVLVAFQSAMALLGTA
jgi:hypothetical protein